MHGKAARAAAAIAALLACLGGPTRATAQSGPATAMDGQWHFFVAPYLWGTAMEGTVGVSEVVSVPVELSFGDIFEKLDFALLGRFEGRKDRLGFGIDTVFMNLGADVTGPVGGQFGLGADVRSFTLEGVTTFRLLHDDGKGSFLDVLGGARYMKNRANLTVERNGDEIAGTDRTLDWVDALLGARFRLGLGRTFALHGRADVAGFGSDVTFQLLGGLEARLGERWKTGAGYRYLDVDYDKGEGLDRRLWKMTYQGPYLFIGYAW